MIRLVVHADEIRVRIALSSSPARGGIVFLVISGDTVLPQNGGGHYAAIG